GVARKALPQAASDGLLLRVGVSHRHVDDLAAVAAEVDAAPIGEPGHGESSKVRERALEVERCRQHLRRAGEKLLVLLELLTLGDVARQGDDPDRPGVLGPNDAGLRPAPPPLAVLPVRAKLSLSA